MKIDPSVGRTSVGMTELKNPTLARFGSLNMLELAIFVADNWGMQTFGIIHDGVVVLEGGVSLPEGARVSVSYPPSPPIQTTPPPRPVVLPIFDYDGPADIDLTNERIAEILDRDDAST